MMQDVNVYACIVVYKVMLVVEVQCEWSRLLSRWVCGRCAVIMYVKCEFV